MAKNGLLDPISDSACSAWRRSFEARFELVRSFSQGRDKGVLLVKFNIFATPLF